MRERKKPLCGTPNAYNQGCRCGLCKAHHAHRCAEQKRARLLKPIPDHVHGTYGGYANWDCRCDGCSAAATVFMREQYVSRLAREVPERLHAVTGYKSWGCRYKSCRRAQHEHYVASYQAT